MNDLKVGTIVQHESGQQSRVEIDEFIRVII